MSILKLVSSCLNGAERDAATYGRILYSLNTCPDVAITPRETGCVIDALMRHLETLETEEYTQDYEVWFFIVLKHICDTI